MLERALRSSYYRFIRRVAAGRGITRAQVLAAAGGRVLNVTATGETLEAAVKRAYEAIDLIDWPEGIHRRDIGWRALGNSR